MSYLDAKKVMAFAEEIVAEETRIHPNWDNSDVIQMIFSAIVKWDERVRSDFTTGIREPLKELEDEGDDQN